MRKLVNAPEPQILKDNRKSWTDDYIENPDSKSKKFRYRDPKIKAALMAETSGKCIYCESKVGHNTPGDTEHKIASSVDKTKHFDWENLTIACTECNRRKNAYDDPSLPFLDPYEDEVDQLVIHYGPVASWAPGESRAEATVRTLELHNASRTELMMRKIEKISEIDNLIGRIKTEPSSTLKKLLIKSLQELRAPSAEYSGMVESVCCANAV